MTKQSKKYILRFQVVNRDIFDAIKNGKKKVETRAGSPKYFNVQAGDVLIFVCGRSKFSRKIRKVIKFKGIEALHKIYKPQTINPNTKSVADSKRMYYSFPGYKEKIKKYGLVAIEL